MESEKFRDELILNFGPSDYSRYGHGIELRDNIVVVPLKRNIPKIAQTIFIPGKGVVTLPLPTSEFEDTYPEKIIVHGLQAVKISLPRAMVGEEIIMPWIKAREEWIAIWHSYWPEEGGLSDSYFEGPFSLDEKCSIKIIEAYSVPREKLQLDEIIKTSPSKLEMITLGRLFC